MKAWRRFLWFHISIKFKNKNKTIGMCGYLWVCFGMYGYVLVCMAMSGYVWVCTGMYSTKYYCSVLKQYCTVLYCNVRLYIV